MSGPKVSINICCYNSVRFIEETLESVFAQTYRNWELVIVNDGSTDETERIVRKYMKPGAPVVYHSQANMGLGRSRNNAIGLSSGDLIALLDHDDVWRPDKLERQVELFARPQTGVVYSDADIVDASLRRLWRYSERVVLRRGAVLPHLFLDNFIVCSSVLIRAAALQGIPLFRPEFRISEEYELFLRLAEKWDYDFVEAPVVQYRMHQTNQSANVRLLQEESLQISNECLARVPSLKAEMGGPALRIRAAGLYGMSLGEAYLLSGRVRRAFNELGDGRRLLRAAPRAAFWYLTSLLGHRTVSRLRMTWRAARAWGER